MPKQKDKYIIVENGTYKQKSEPMKYKDARNYCKKLNENSTKRHMIIIWREK